jgi:hypothetical protein
MSGTTLQVLPGLYGVARLGAAERLPWWLDGDGLTSVTRTADELSIVCREDRVPSGVRCERGWRALALDGPLDFGEVGVLARIAGALAGAGVALLAISTYDTDLILVQGEQLDAARRALRAAGYGIDEAR